MQIHTASGRAGACFGIVAVLALVPTLGKATEDPPALVSGSLCIATEKVIFQCRIGSRIASVCANKSAKIAQYRFGKPGAVELAYSASSSGGITWARVGYSGGGELQLNFSNNQHKYVLYSRVVRTGFGPGTNDPKFEAGVAVARGNKLVSDRRCSDTDDPFRSDPESVLSEGEFSDVWEADR